ncbi:hypothetical protein [Streptomyces niveus]|uniref:hypothetical protein n=1 Tax=Streptomyces niveus TaxID=193462 RepID=UPI003431664E
MTRTAFENYSALWGGLTFFEAIWIAVLWRTRTRVLGVGVYRTPGARRVRRGACDRRVDGLLAKLESKGVPAEGRPDKDQLVDRWHRIVAGRCVSALLQVVPILVVVLPFWWATALARTTAVTPFWMFAAVAGFGAVSITLLAADERAAVVSDPAGTVTVESIRFLEMLLMPAGRRSQDSALEVHGKVFGRLRNALRAHARHGTRTMPPDIRERVRETTERLIGALADANQRYLLGEGPGRETAEHDLSRLVADVLRHSCRPRAQRDSLVIVDATLLADVPKPDEAGTVAEPLRSRLLAGMGRLAVAMGLFAGAFLFRGEGEASVLLVGVGVATVALVLPPLREALLRFGGLVLGAFGGLSGGGVPETPHGEPSPPEPASATPCPHCADRSPVTAGSRPVG